jgi:hypothetical protein
MFKRLIFIVVLFFASIYINAQITESFDSWTDAGYAGVSAATLGSGDWESNNALVGTDIPNSGAKYVRFNDDSGSDEYLEYQGTDGNGKDNGLGTISFWYRHWDADGSSVQFQVQYNQSGGGWTNIGGVVTVTTTTYTQFVSTPNILGDDILIRVISIADAERLAIDDFEMYDYTAPCVADTEPTTISNTLTFSNIDCSSIQLDWINGNGTSRIVVASTSAIAGTPSDQTNYAPNSIYGTGNIIAANEYTIYNGTGSNITVTGLAASTTYHFSVFEYNGTTPNCDENYLISTSLTGNAPTIACGDAEVTGILIDACGGNEGIDEFFTFENGTSSLSLADLIADFPNGESYCNSGCGTKTWVTNATYVAQLNTTAGCAGLFVEADPIPAGAKAIVFTGSSPSYNFDFNGLCGSGTYYAIFANNTNTGGRFGNYNADCSQLRTLTVHFGGGDSDAVTYQRCSLSDTDGDYVAFDTPGTASYNNDGCTPTAILPIDLLYFKGKEAASENLLEWSTTTEINNDYFTLERSHDALNFNEIGILSGAGNSFIQLDYKFIDDAPNSGINYYRLIQTDYNGDFSISNIIALNNNQLDAKIYVSHKTLRVKLTEEISSGKIEIIDALGRTVYSDNITASKNINLDNYISGIYLIKIDTPSNTIIRKIKF